MVQSETAIFHMLDGTLFTDNCRLVVIDGPSPGAEVALIPDRSVRVGKGEDVELRISDPAVSRHHFTISIVANGFLVEDAGSKNGTHVGGVRVERAVLVPGAVLRIGSTNLRILPAGETDRVYPSARTRFGELIGESSQMREVFALLERLAPTDVAVLLRGETGTGKELAVRALHHYGTRCRRPLVVFDCAGVAPSLIESELFGHVKGAFTGAVTDLPGVFERALGGTVFIDEIGELPMNLQPRLLRVLDAHTVRRLGDTRDFPIDVRVVAATNRNLAKMVRSGEFRQDLFFRLSVVDIEMPPLRHHPDDVEPLVRHFMAARGLSPNLELKGRNLRILKSYHWPGNIRELRNVIERALSLAHPHLTQFDDLRIEVGHEGLEATTRQINYALPFKEAKAAAMSRFEIDYLGHLLSAHGGNLTRAAQTAQLDRGYLRNLLRRHRLLPKGAPQDEADEAEESESLADSEVTLPGCSPDDPKKN